MARDDIFLTRHSSIPSIGEGQPDRAIINRLGIQVVTDFFTQLCLSGLTYHVQVGTEDAGVAATGAMDDQLAFMLVDQSAGYALIPLLYEINVGVLAGGTIAMSMLELDKGKNRYSAGGAAFVPANLNNQSAAGAFAGTAYICPADITPAAKSAVPLSVELARRTWTEDALADTIGYPGTWDPCVYSVKSRPMAIGHGTCSLIGHHGSATADMTSYGVLQFAQLSIAQVAI